MIRALAQAVRILTIVPVPFVRHEDADFESATQFFPLVGALVALVSGATYAVTGARPLSAVLAIAASIIITGALHEDGLADSADGLFGGATPEERLRILRDSRIGSFGALALILTILIRGLALAQFSASDALVRLLAVHAAARLACVIAMVSMPYAGENAKLSMSRDRISGRHLVPAAVFGLAPLILLPGDRIAPALLAATLAAGSVGWIAMKKIGGRTGDILGAIEQTAEIGLWLGIAL